MKEWLCFIGPDGRELCSYDVSIMLCQLDVIFGDNSDMECRKLEHLEGLVKDV